MKKLLPPRIRRGVRGIINAPRRVLDRWAIRHVRKAIYQKTGDAFTVRWLGHPIWQYPIDAWIIQEVVAELKPDIIIETGTFRGGSAYYFACLCDLLHHGEVMSIDTGARGTIPHPRVTYFKGSSVDPSTIAVVAERVRQVKARRVLVMLDSLHRADHVRKELDAYAPLIPVGSYIHVQDGNTDEFSHFRMEQPGPMVATKAFLKDHPEFIRDLDIELRYVITEHPYGWLKRIAPSPDLETKPPD